VDDLPHLALIEEVRIGSVDDPDIGFSNISDIVVGDDGLVYVFERAEREVRVYDEDVLVRRFGRSGSGPGEFEMPTAMGLLGDTLWVTDFRAQRLSLFRRDGTFIGSYNVPPIAIELQSGINVMLYVGGLADDGTLTSAWGVMIPENPPADTFLIPIVRMDTSGAVIDTVRHQSWAFPDRPVDRAAGVPTGRPHGARRQGWLALAAKRGRRECRGALAGSRRQWQSARRVDCAARAHAP
jgi:hypothetical protein